MTRRDAVALIVGVLAGTLLAAGYFASTSGVLFGTTMQRVRGGAVVALLYAVPIAFICAGLWRMMRVKERQGWIDAALLGGGITLLAWMIGSYGEGDLGAELTLGLPYALCGGLAGMLTWRVGRSDLDRS